MCFIIIHQLFWSVSTVGLSQCSLMPHDLQM